MKNKALIRLLAPVGLAAALVGAYLKGRNDVLKTEFKRSQANMLMLTQWETNHPPELKEFVKAHYYYMANHTPRSWVGRPHDYGPVSTNLTGLTGFKGPTSAQEQYRIFLERFNTGSTPQTSLSP